MDAQPHWISSIAWPDYCPGGTWPGDLPESLLVGRMDGSLGLIEVTDATSIQRLELEHCYRKEGLYPVITDSS